MAGRMSIGCQFRDPQGAGKEIFRATKIICTSLGKKPIPIGLDQSYPDVALGKRWRRGLAFGQGSVQVINQKLIGGNQSIKRSPLVKSARLQQEIFWTSQTVSRRR